MNINTILHSLTRLSICLVVAFVFLAHASSAHAAITYVQSAQNKTSGSPTSLATAFVSSVTAKDTIVVAISTWNAVKTAIVSGVTDNQGNTYVKAVQQGEGTVNEPIAVWYSIGIASTGSLTVTATLAAGGEITMAIHEYSGIGSIDVTAHAASSVAGTAADSGGATTTNPNDLLFGAVNSPDSGTITASPGTGYTARQSQTDNATYEVLFTEDQTVTSTGTYHATMTMGGTNNWLAVLVTFAASSSGNPKSTNYTIQSYQFGGGGTATSSSTNFALNGVVGQVESASVSSTNFNAGNGLAYIQNANEPPAPTLTNPSSYVNKLTLSINTGGNTSDTKFAIKISSDNFVTLYGYVQADDSIGANPVYQTNTVWGATGFNITGLGIGTTYYARVSAMQGNFTQSPYGPSASAATVNPTFSYSLTPNTASLGTLTPGTVVTSGTTITATVSTNGIGGATVYVYDTNTGLLSNSTTYTIAATSSNLAVASEGYGLQGTSTTQTSGGPMEILSPYNGTVSTVGIVDTTKRPIFDSTAAPVTSGQAVFSILAKAGSTAKAATDYTDTLFVIAAAAF